MYEHKCLDCGVEWETKTNTRATYCKTCAMKFAHQGVKKKWDNEVRVKYYFFCATCSDVRISKNLDRDTIYCSDCSRRYLKRLKRTSIYFDFYTMTIKDNIVRHFKFCKECGHTEEVTKQYARTYICKTCRDKISGVTREKKSSRFKSKAASVKGIDGKHKISPEVKARFENKELEKFVEEIEKPSENNSVCIRPLTDKELDMIEQFLRSKDV